MEEDVTESNKNSLIPKILNEAVKVWQDYIVSKLKLNLSEVDFQLHLTMMKRLWKLADSFNPSEKVAFPVL